jgi:phenylacetic acid degradation operon negative regulatory protein
MPATPDPGLEVIRRRELSLSSARSLLLTVLGEYVLPQEAPTWTGALIQTMALLGVAEKAARQALARTAAEGWVVSSRQGRRAQWDLTEAGRRLLADGARRIYSFGQQSQPWDGRWLLLLAGAPDAGREVRRQLRTQLTWAGFGTLPSGAWVCPDPGREPEASRIIADLGLAATSMSFIASYGQIGAQADIVDLAWDLGTLELRYKQFIDTFEPLAATTDAEMLTAQILLVHEWRRFPFLDPQLPRDLLPAGWLGTDAASLFHARHASWREGAGRHWAVVGSAGDPVT